MHQLKSTWLYHLQSLWTRYGDNHKQTNQYGLWLWTRSANDSASWGADLGCYKTLLHEYLSWLSMNCPHLLHIDLRRLCSSGRPALDRLDCILVNLLFTNDEAIWHTWHLIPTLHETVCLVLRTYLSIIGWNSIEIRNLAHLSWVISPESRRTSPLLQLLHSDLGFDISVNSREKSIL